MGEHMRAARHHHGHQRGICQLADAVQQRVLPPRQGHIAQIHTLAAGRPMFGHRRGGAVVGERTVIAAFAGAAEHGDDSRRVQPVGAVKPGAVHGEQHTLAESFAQLPVDAGDLRLFQRGGVVAQKHAMSSANGPVTMIDPAWSSRRHAPIPSHCSAPSSSVRHSPANVRDSVRVRAMAPAIASALGRAILPAPRRSVHSIPAARGRTPRCSPRAADRTSP